MLGSYQSFRFHLFAMSRVRQHNPYGPSAAASTFGNQHTALGDHGVRFISCDSPRLTGAVPRRVPLAGEPTLAKVTVCVSNTGVRLLRDRARAVVACLAQVDIAAVGSEGPTRDTIFVTMMDDDLPRFLNAFEGASVLVDASGVWIASDAAQRAAVQSHLETLSSAQKRALSSMGLPHAPVVVSALPGVQYVRFEDLVAEAPAVTGDANKLPVAGQDPADHLVFVGQIPFNMAEAHFVAMLRSLSPGHPIEQCRRQAAYCPRRKTLMYRGCATLRTTAAGAEALRTFAHKQVLIDGVGFRFATTREETGTLKVIAALEKSQRKAQNLPQDTLVIETTIKEGIREEW